MYVCVCVCVLFRSFWPNVQMRSFYYLCSVCTKPEASLHPSVMERNYRKESKDVKKETEALFEERNSASTNAPPNAWWSMLVCG